MKNQKKKKRRRKKQKELKWDEYPFDNNSDNVDYSTTDIDLLNDDSCMSSDESKNKKIMIKAADILLNELDIKVIKLSHEIKDLIENNISIIQPNDLLINEIVKFVRFTEMETIVFNTNNKITDNSKKYNYNNMGVVNNTKTLYKIIEKELYKSMNEYKKNFHEFNNLNKSKYCSLPCL